MAKTALIIRPNPTQIESLVLDCSVTESHKRSSEVTKHPVEEGFDITDHVRPKPNVITIEGIVTNTPFNAQSDHSIQLGQVIALDRTSSNLVSPVQPQVLQGDAGRSRSAFEYLEKLQKGQLITIATGLALYTSMQITDIDVPRDKGTVSSLRFTITAEQIRVVQNQQTRVRASKVPARVKTGNQLPAPTTSVGVKAIPGAKAFGNAVISFFFG